jgi:hypothetical protein
LNDCILSIYVYENPSGQYLGLIVLSHCLAMVQIRIRDILVVLPYYSCGESCLLVSWCVGDRCNMAVRDEDRGRSRTHGVEDQIRSSIGRVLGGQTVERSSDTVCGLHRAQGDDERGFLNSASKPRSMVSPGLASKPVATVSLGLASKLVATVSPGLTSKLVATVSPGLASK